MIHNDFPFRQIMKAEMLEFKQSSLVLILEMDRKDRGWRVPPLLDINTTEIVLQDVRHVFEVAKQILLHGSFVRPLILGAVR